MIKGLTKLWYNPTSHSASISSPLMSRESSAPHGIKFKSLERSSTGRKAWISDGQTHPNTSPSLFTHTHVVSTWQAYIHNVHCLKSIIIFFLICLDVYGLDLHVAGLPFRQLRLKTKITEIICYESLRKILQEDPKNIHSLKVNRIERQHFQAIARIWQPSPWSCTRSHLSMCCHVAGVTTMLLGLEADQPAAHCRTWAVDGNLVALIQGWILLPLGFI